MGRIVDRPKRIRRFVGANDAYQVSAFPDSAPDSETPLLRRTGFITDIEMFADEGWRLANQIEEEELATDILRAGLDWEHAVANTNGLLISTQPDKVSDPELQLAIDQLEDATEKLVDQLNQISLAHPERTRALQKVAEERKEKE